MIFNRSKHRTPHEKPSKTMSVDRIGQIQPKFDISEPMALLRYANHGETVISLTGSPVVGLGQPLDSVANINIPIKNGIISLRPTAEMRHINPSSMPKIDSDTLKHLKTLQKNLHFFTLMVEKQSPEDQS